MYENYGYEYLLFSLLNLPGAAILNVYDVIKCGCSIVVYKRTLILNNSGNHITSSKFKMAARGKFKRENS